MSDVKELCVRLGGKFNKDVVARKEEKVICAGFGGQGAMGIGKSIAKAGMKEGKEVSWLPSYGPEMRGGTANCAVIVSESLIGSPVITNDATTAIILNLPSLIKFEKDVLPGGVLMINSSLIEQEASRDDISVYYIPANDLANEIGNARGTNMIMLGAYVEITKVIDLESVKQGVRDMFSGRKEKLIPKNIEAIDLGARLVREAVAKIK